jgi:hypothetical protein
MTNNLTVQRRPDWNGTEVWYVYRDGTHCATMLRTDWFGPYTHSFHWHDERGWNLRGTEIDQLIGEERNR